MMTIKNNINIEEFYSLRDELLSVLDDWYDLQFVKKKEIDFKYENIFGDIEDEIELKSKNAAELQRKVELLCSEMKSGERISKSTLEKINNIIDKEISYNHSYKNSFYQPIIHNRKDNKFKEKKDVNKIYRSIVKTLHPDIVGDDNKSKYWNCVQAAYKERDCDKLYIYQKTLCKEYLDECIESDKIYVALAEMQTNIIAEKRKIEQMKMQEPFIFENKLEDRKWINQRKNLLFNKLDTLERNIHFNRKIIKNLTAHID